MRKLKAIILRNENDKDHLQWVEACERNSSLIDYEVVDLTSVWWFELVTARPVDILLAKPGGLTSHFKQLYDERIYILSQANYRIFPSPLEIYLYENKRLLSYWLKSNQIPHPATNVFYSQYEAIEYIRCASFPIVAKTNIGASGSGVRLLYSGTEALAYIEQTFYGKGSPQRTGPNFAKGGIVRRGMHYLFHPTEIARKISLYMARAASLQKGFVIFQEYIKHDFEWRVVRIGDSFFAHKKLKTAEKASGSLLKNYDNPPFQLLDFVRNLTDQYGLFSQAVDIFESDRGYLINELQCIFGQSDPYQMKVDGKFGRYRHIEGTWVFEPGDWARNQCFDLRLEFVLESSRGLRL